MIAHKLGITKGIPTVVSPCDFEAEAQWYKENWTQLYLDQTANVDASDPSNNPGYAWRSGQPWETTESRFGNQLYPSDVHGNQTYGTEAPEPNNRQDAGL